MGLSGLNSIYLIVLDIGLSLSWFASFWTGPQSGLVVLSGGTSDCVADSCTALLSGRSFLSHSRIRVIDVLGTVLFAQLPLLGMNLISLLPAMRMMSQMNMNMSPEEMLAQPYFILAMILTLLGLPFLILTLIWMFNALKVSCNLKQWKLWTVALIGIIGGDVLCRFLIGWLY